MVELTTEDKISHSLATARRSCMLCMGRSRLRPTDAEKDAAFLNVKNLIQLFNEQFDELRHYDASPDAIQKALANKRLCMDAADLCETCDRSVEQIARALMKLNQR